MNQNQRCPLPLNYAEKPHFERRDVTTRTAIAFGLVALGCLTTVGAFDVFHWRISGTVLAVVWTLYLLSLLMGFTATIAGFLEQCNSGRLWRMGLCLNVAALMICVVLSS